MHCALRSTRTAAVIRSNVGPNDHVKTCRNCYLQNSECLQTPLWPHTLYTELENPLSYQCRDPTSCSTCAMSATNYQEQIQHLRTDVLDWPSYNAQFIR